MNQQGPIIKRRILYLNRFYITNEEKKLEAKI